MKGTDVVHCKQAADKVQALQDEIARLVEEWHQTFDPAERARIAAQLRAVRAELPPAQLELELCMGGQKSPLKATFSGTYTLETTDSYALGPYSGDIIIGCQFSGDRTQVAITNFPSITTDKFSVGLLVLTK